MIAYHLYFSFFFFNDTATTEIYTLSLHDALPILGSEPGHESQCIHCRAQVDNEQSCGQEIKDRKSTRLNSSHSQISYAVFCLKKKKKNKDTTLYHAHYDNIPVP